MKTKFIFLMVFLPFLVLGQFNEDLFFYPNDQQQEDEFGNSVFKTNLGFFVGAYYADVEGSNTGAVYFLPEGDVNNFQKLSAGDDAMPEDHFGSAIAAYQNFLLVAANADDTNGYYEVGSVYFFEYDGSQWVKQQKFVYPYLNDDDAFGWSLSIYDSVAAISAPGYFSGKGGVFIYKLNSNQWVFDTLIQPYDIAFSDYFGRSVYLNENKLIVGASGKNSSQGKAYVFEYENNSWTLVGELEGNDLSSNDKFGEKVFIDNNLAFVAAPQQNSNQGAVYVFQYDGTQWIQVAKLLASDGAEGDYFGSALAYEANYLVVGAWAKNNMTGAVYIYSLVDGQWSQIQKITASNADANDRFGNAVYIQNGYIVIGAFYNSDYQLYGGSIYGFTLPPPTIDVQPQDQEVCENSDATFTIVASNAGTYQWYKNGQAIYDDDHFEGTSTSTLIIRNTETYDEGTYYCIVSNSSGSVQSDDATLTVDLPEYAEAGDDIETCEDTVTLNANEPTYGTGAWSVLSGSATFEDISNPNTKAYGFSGGDNMLLWTITNGACVSYDYVFITFNGAVITSQPQNIEAQIGDNVTFLVEARGDIAEYNWFKVGNNEILSYDNVLTLNNITENDLGEYFCKIVTNNCGDYYSDTATLSLANTFVNTNPNISIFPNPTSNLLNITSKENIIKISLVDLKGKEIESFYPNSTEIQINLKAYPSGIYFIKIYDNKGFYKTKVIKK